MIPPNKAALDFIESLPDDVSFNDIINGLKTLSFEERYVRLSHKDQKMVLQVISRLAEKNKAKDNRIVKWK